MNRKQARALVEQIAEPLFVDFGDVARNQCNMQCQYASRYIRGRADGTPALGEGLRFSHLDTGSYHDIRIHRDDVAKFVLRLNNLRHNQGW